MLDKVQNSKSAGPDFGSMARTYDSWYETPAGRAHDNIQKQDVTHLLRAGRGVEQLLDVGCGTGHWSSFFVQMGYRVTGIDISPAMINVAREQVPQCRFIIGDVYELPFAEDTFDVTASMATLEFLPDAAAAVRAIARCTKPGGSILIGTLNRLAKLNQQRLREGKEPYASGNLMSPDELYELLAPLGRVRMISSTLHGRNRRPVLITGIANRLPLQKSKLRGAFIVAEVRL